MTTFRPLAKNLLWLLYLRAALRLVLLWLPILIIMPLPFIGGFDGGQVGGYSLMNHRLVTTILWMLWGCLVLMSLMQSVWFPYLHYSVLGYCVGTNDLLVRRGVLFRTIHALPLSRIQHIDSLQGPLERILGLTSLSIYTASGGGADAVIPGLTNNDAATLRDQLLSHTDDDDGV